MNKNENKNDMTSSFLLLLHHCTCSAQGSGLFFSLALSFAGGVIYYYLFLSLALSCPILPCLVVACSDLFIHCSSRLYSLI